jgi:hypothetical protein
LSGVAVVSACNAWAVGTDINDGQAQTLIEHWNGAFWTVVTSPDPGDEANSLAGVRAVSATNAWAVGRSTDSNNGTAPLILHWNGSKWSAVQGPSVPGISTLAAVRPVSANDVWAVGNTNNGKITTLIEHWNGAQWSVVPSPSPGSGFDDELSGVAGTSATDAWAVGQFTPAGGNQTALILHWDGTAWKQVDSSIPAGSFSSLGSVAATSTTNAWAAGFTDGLQPLILHWNGTAWQQAPTPPLSSGTGQVAGVSASTASNAWAVGSTFDGFTHRNLVLHWDGSAWSRVTSPDFTASDFLGNVHATTNGGFWAVGASNADGPGPEQAIAIHCC